MCQWGTVLTIPERVVQFVVHEIYSCQHGNGLPYVVTTVATGRRRSTSGTISVPRVTIEMCVCVCIPVWRKHVGKTATIITLRCGGCMLSIERSIYYENVVYIFHWNTHTCACMVMKNDVRKHNARSDCVRKLCTHECIASPIVCKKGTEKPHERKRISSLPLSNAKASERPSPTQV